MELAHPAGAKSLAPQPSQLASTVASTKKSLLANLRILGGRAQPSPNGIPVGRKIMKSAQDHALPAPVIGRADGGLNDRTGWSKASPLGWRGSVNARKFGSHFGKIQL